MNEVAVAVREATSADVEALAEAHRLGQSAVTDARGGPLDTLLRGRGEPIDETFVRDLDDVNIDVWIGTGDDAFLGYCVMGMQDLRNGDSLAVVRELCVHPEARGIGVGYALMRTATDAAVDAGCCGIDARALPGDRATKNFFESFGLVARVIEVHKALAE